MLYSQNEFKTHKQEKTTEESSSTFLGLFTKVRNDTSTSHFVGAFYHSSPNNKVSNLAGFMIICFKSVNLFEFVDKIQDHFQEMCEFTENYSQKTALLINCTVQIKLDMCARNGSRC